MCLCPQNRCLVCAVFCGFGLAEMTAGAGQKNPSTQKGPSWDAGCVCAVRFKRSKMEKTQSKNKTNTNRENNQAIKLQSPSGQAQGGWGLHVLVCCCVCFVFACSRFCVVWPTTQNTSRTQQQTTETILDNPLGANPSWMGSTCFAVS